MQQAIAIIVAVGALGFILWMLLSSKQPIGQNVEIDPNDARQIGTLIGLMGGSIGDAAATQFALRRFEEQHGRKATMKDMGVVAGLMRTLR